MRRLNSAPHFSFALLLVLGGCRHLSSPSPSPSEGQKERVPAPDAKAQALVANHSDGMIDACELPPRKAAWLTCFCRKSDGKLLAESGFGTLASADCDLGDVCSIQGEVRERGAQCVLGVAPIPVPPDEFAERCRARRAIRPDRCKAGVGRINRVRECIRIGEKLIACVFQFSASPMPDEDREAQTLIKEVVVSLERSGAQMRGCFESLTVGAAPPNRPVYMSATLRAGPRLAVEGVSVTSYGSRPEQDTQLEAFAEKHPVSLCVRKVLSTNISVRPVEDAARIDVLLVSEP